MAGSRATAPPNSTANRSSEMAPSSTGWLRMRRTPSNASRHPARTGAGPGLSPQGLPALRHALAVRDTAAAMCLLLRTSPEAINGEIFNVGSDENNYQLGPLAERVERAGDPVPAERPDAATFEQAWADGITGTELVSDLDAALDAKSSATQ